MNTIHKNFKKVRVRRKPPTKNPIQIKLDARRELKTKLNTTLKCAERHELEDKLNELEEDISRESSQIHKERVFSHIQQITNEDGHINTTNVWKLRKKVCPKPSEQLTAKKDTDGNRVTNPERIKEIYLEAYKNRLQHRIILPELQMFKELREELFQLRLSAAKKNRSPDWTIADLDKVLGKMKKGKAADPTGLVNDLFVPENIGDDLKQSILVLMNKIKKDFREPEFMSLADVTSFWKGKGPKDDIESERGIFILSTLRMIKDKLIHNDISKNLVMSDSQVGARTDYNIRNHLFVLYSAINSAIQKETPPIDIHMYDLMKCFDGLWLEECCNDLYEAGVQDDKLAMIYEGNRTNRMAVKTPIGLTERVLIERVVTQGGVTGPICCATQTDSIGKDSLERKEHLYLYKGTVGIPALTMIDDVAQISLCGLESIKDNAFINARFEEKKQKLNEKKCHKIHCGRPSRLCPTLRAHSTPISKVGSEKYVGDIICHTGKHTPNTKVRRSKGIGIVNEILSILDNLCLGQYYFHVAMILRPVMLLSVLLFNSDAWLRLTKSDIAKLEKVDEMLLRKILKTPTSTPIAALYLETGAIPIRFWIKQKRILFLHHILTRSEDSLISQVFWAQVENPAKGDWCTVVAEDLKCLKLHDLQFGQISLMSKETIKTKLKTNIKEVAHNYLLNAKESLSKLSDLSYDEFSIQPYLVDPLISNRHKRLLFQWRTRMIKVNWNYGLKINCPLCDEHADTQEHLLQCAKLCDVTTTPTLFVDKVERALRMRELILEEEQRNKQKVKSE